MSHSLQPHGLQLARLLCPWGFPRQEYWSGLPCPPPGDLSNLGVKSTTPVAPTLKVNSIAEPPGRPPSLSLSLSLSLCLYLSLSVYVYVYIYISHCTMLHIERGLSLWKCKEIQRLQTGKVKEEKYPTPEEILQAHLSTQKKNAGLNWSNSSPKGNRVSPEAWLSLIYNLSVPSVPHMHTS